MGVMFLLIPHRPPILFPFGGGFYRGAYRGAVVAWWGVRNGGGGTTVGSSLPNTFPGGGLNVATGVALDGAEEGGGAPGILPGSDTTLSPTFLPDLVATLTGTDTPSWHFSPAPLHSKSFSPNTPPPRVHPYGGVFLSIQVRGVTFSLLRELSGCFSPSLLPNGLGPLGPGHLGLVPWPRHKFFRLSGSTLGLPFLLLGSAGGLPLRRACLCCCLGTPRRSTETKRRQRCSLLL